MHPSKTDSGIVHIRQDDRCILIPRTFRHEPGVIAITHPERRGKRPYSNCRFTSFSGKS